MRIGRRSQSENCFRSIVICPVKYGHSQEDDLHASRYATEYVRGLQGGEDWPRYIKAASTLKHFSAYSLEAWGGVDRDHFDAVVPGADLNDYYWKPFAAGVKAGMACSVVIPTSFRPLQEV